MVGDIGDAGDISDAGDASDAGNDTGNVKVAMLVMRVMSVSNACDAGKPMFVMQAMLAMQGAAESMLVMPLTGSACYARWFWEPRGNKTHVFSQRARGESKQRVAEEGS